MASSFLKKKAQERREIIDKTWGADAYNGANQRKEEEQKTSGGSNAAGGNLPVEESTSGKASSYLREKAQKRREVTRQNTPTTSRNNEPSKTEAKPGHKSLKENEAGARAQIAQNAERRRAEGQGDLFAQVGGTVDYHLGNIKDFLFGNEYAKETEQINDEAKRLYGALTSADAPLSLKGESGKSVIDSLSDSKKALDGMEQRLGQMMEEYKRNPSDALAAQYDQLATQYNQAVAEHNKAYAQYEPQLKAYNDALNAYNAYVTEHGDRISVPMADEYSPYREQLDALESEITRLGKRKAEIHNALSGLSRAAQYGGAVNLEGKRKEYADEIAAIDAQLLPLEARRNELVKEGGYLSDDDILGGLAYGGERFLAGALGMGENITDFIGTTLYGALEGVTSLGGYAPNPVSKWAGDAYDSFAGNSITADYEESIRQRYKPTPKDEELTGFMQTVEQVALPIAAGYGIGKLAGMGAGATTGSLAAPNTATIAANATKGVFGANAAGGATREAHAAGASHAESLTYGWLIGAMEMSIEELSGAIPGLPDGSKMANVVKKVFSDPRVHAVVSHPAVQRLLGGVGEGAEEALSAIFTPYIQRATYDPNAPLATAEDIGEQALLGGLASLCIGAGIDIPTYVAESIYARNRLAVDEFDAETIQGILDTGLESPTDTNSYKIAAELKQKLDAGKDLTASEVMDLYRENVKQVNAENAEQGADEAIMDAAREAVGVEPVGGDAVQGVQEVSRENDTHPIQSESAVEAARNAARTMTMERWTGYGEHGTKTFTDLVEEMNADPMKVRKSFQAAYEAGLANVPRSKINLLDTVQATAYNAGQMDKIALDAKDRKAGKVTVREDAGFVYDTLPADVTPMQAKAVDMLAKATGVRVQIAKGLKGNAEIRDDGTVLIAEDFEREVKGKKRSIVFYAAHEIGMHRLMQLAPKEGRAFINALIADKNSALPYGAHTDTELKQSNYAQQNVSLTIDKAMEEVSADAVLGLYEDEEAFFAAIDRIMNGTNEQAKKGARTFKQWLDDTVRKLKQIVAKLSGKERTQVQETLNEVTALRDLYERAMTAAVDRAKAQGATKNAAQTDGGEVLHALKRISGLTETDVRNLLEHCVNGAYADKSYIPMRRNTPGILISEVSRHSEGRVVVENLPIIMEVGKVRQAMEEDIGSGHGGTRQHGISVNGMISIILGMDDPAYIVYQENGRYTEIVRYFDDGGKAALAALDFSNLKNPAYMNGYEGGLFNVMVTAFNPDNLKGYLTNGRNEVIYDKKKDAPQRGSGSKLPSHLNGTPFNDSVAQVEVSVKDEAVEMSDLDVQHSLRTKEPPKNVGIAYKVFFAKNGQLYPPMVANPGGEGTPVGVWLDADVGVAAEPSKTGRPQVKAGGKGTQGGGGSLAFRPGWHLGDLPMATQFARKNPETGAKDLFPADFVWAECEYAMDHDYQEEAMSYGYTENGKFRHSYAGLPRLPEDGYYRYRTNPNPDTVPWVITGAMRVKRILTDAETDNILRDAGVEPMKRQGGPINLEKLGLKEGMQYSLKDSDPTKMEQDLNALRQQRTELQDEIDGAYLDDLPQADINRLENRMYKLEAEIDKLVAQERRAAVKTSMNDILSNLSAYRRSDLESLAEQVSNGNWEGYEDLSRAELEDALREEIEGRELNALEMQSAKHGLYVRPVSKGQQGQKVVSLFGNEGATFEEDGVQHSLKSLQHDITEGKMFDDLVSAGVFTKKEAGLLKTNLDRLIKYMMPNANILDMNEDYDRDNRPFGAYKPNSDPLYKISLDFSTLCRKRLMTQYVIEQLQLRENRPMSAEEQIAIRSMLLDYAQQEKALQVACAMCYVEAARLKAPKQIEAFFNNTESILRKHFAKKDHVFNAKVIEAQKKFKRDHGYDEDAPKKDMKQKDRTAFDKMSAAMRKGYVPNAEQQAVIDTAVKLPRSTFLTAANLTALSIDHPEIYDAYTSHIRASTRSKGLEGDIPYYYGDSQGAVSDSFIDGVNAENGMRFDSWSDFQMKHMLDMITAVVDLSVRGSKMHGYTKFPEMVRIFGKTGMMFNLSGVTEGTGFDENGNLIFSSTEGIDYAEAIKLRKAFPETAGLQCIGVSDDHIRALLRSKDVDYVIPYHTSGMNATLRKMAGIHDWSNYEKTQHARPDPKAKKPANAEKWHVEPVWSEFFVNEGKDGYEVMENTAKRYAEMCRERGLIPKFDQFLDEPGYWKLLIDRKMVNQITGEIIEQQPVKPIFDFDLIEAEIDREVSNYDPDLEKKALKYVVDNFDAVNQRIKDLKKRHPKKSMMTMGNEILQAYAEGVKKGAGVQHSLKDDGDLVAENEKLREVNRALREQFKVTKLAKVDKKSLEKFSKQLLKDWQSRADITETRDALEEMYTFIRTEMEKDEPDMAAMEQKAYEVAEGILTQSVEVDDQMYQDYKELRSRLRTTGISIDPSYGSSLMGYEDLQDFRKRNMGRIKLRKDGLPVDVLYQELASTYPDLFNEAEHSNPADQLVHLAEVLEEMRPIEVNPYKHEMREAATWLATDIMHRIYELPQAKPTFADKAAAKLSEQKAKDKQKLYDAVTGERMAAGREMVAQKRMGQQKLTELREKKNERISKLIADSRDKMRLVQVEERVKRETAVKTVKDHYRAKEAKASESRQATILRAKIVRHLNPMIERVTKATNKKHIPDNLKGTVIALLESINTGSSYSYYPATLREIARSDGKSGGMTGERVPLTEGVLTKRTVHFMRLQDLFTEIKANGLGNMSIDPSLLGSTEDGIPSKFQEVIKMGDKPLSEMNLKELTTVWEVLRATEHAIFTANKAFASEKRAEIDAWANSFEEDTESRKQKRALTKQHWTLDIETPYTFFSHFGEAGNDLWRMLRAAQDDQYLKKRKLDGWMGDIASKEDRKKLTSEKDAVTFDTARGEKLTLTRAHIMEVYLLSQRKAALSHLVGNGIRQPKVGKIDEGTTAIRLTEMDVAKIASSLSEEEKATADKFQALTKVLAEWANEAHLKVFGYQKFGDPNYWPIKSSSLQTKKDVGQKADNRSREISNIGAAKELIPHASNAVDLPGIFDTFDQHASEMLTYAAWLAPMEDAKRLLNYRFMDEDGTTRNTMAGLLDYVTGKGGAAYWQDLMVDIQNGLSMKPETAADAVIGRAMSTVKRSAVAANARVVIQQPTAYARAALVLDPDIMLLAAGKAATVKSAVAGWKKAVKLSPIAMMKQEGGYEIAANPKQLGESLYQSETKWGKIKDFAKEAGMALPGAADAFTWGIIWNACEMQVKRNSKDLAPGTASFDAAVKALFEDVIEQTQVVDGVLQRSAMMRAGSVTAKSLASFTGEPTQSANMVVRAYDKLRYETDPKKRGKAIKGLSRAAAVYVVNAVLNAFMQSLVDGFRDDDDDKDYWERVWAAFHGINGDEETWRDFASAILMEGNVVNGLNPLGWLPLTREVMSLIQGYSVERLDTSAIADVITSAQNLDKAISGDGKQTVGYALLKTGLTGLRLFGSGASNFVRDIEGAVRSVQVGTKAYKARYDTMKLMYQPENNKSQYMDVLYNAYQDGGDDYEQILDDMLKGDYFKGEKTTTQEYIMSAMDDRLMEEQGVKMVSELDQRFLFPDQQKGYDSRMAALEKSGLWDDANKKQRNGVKADLYGIVTESKGSEDMREKIAKGKPYDLDETEYLLYQLALEMHDKPNDKGKLGTYTSAEKAEALLAADLGDDEMAFLWDSKKGYEALDDGISMEHYIRFAAGVASLEPGVDYKKGNSASRKAAVRAVLRDMGLTPGSREYKWLWGTEY